MRAIHFGEKDKCKWCNRLFSPTHILDHQKKCNYNENFNSKKLRCNICNSDKLYASEKSLKVHQKLQHSETKKMYPCNLCEKSFATEYKAKKHIKDVHIEKSEFVHCKKCDKLMKPFSLPLHVKKCRGQKSKSEKARQIEELSRIREASMLTPSNITGTDKFKLMKLIMEQKSLANEIKQENNSDISVNKIKRKAAQID